MSFNILLYIFNPSIPAYNAICGSFSFTISSISSLSFIYGGLLIITSYFLFIFSNKSLSIKLTSKLSAFAFSLATSNASLLISIKSTSEFGNSFFKVNPITPLPHPISKMFILSLKFCFIYFIVFSTNSSVSNLGINTFSLIINLFP